MATTSIFVRDGQTRKSWVAKIRALWQRKKNQRFRELSPEKRRVAIAKDVIAWLDLRVILATYGTYLTVDAWSDEGAPDDAGKWKLDAKVGSGVACEVCAIGALVVAKAMRVDGIGAMEAHDGGRTELVKFLSDTFPQDMLHDIEEAYEGREIARRGRGNDAACEFASAHPRETRLRMIMENIIANGGDFRPGESAS